MDPEGNALAEAPDDQPRLLTAEPDLAAVDRVHTDGTEYLNPPWSQFREGSPPSTFRLPKPHQPATWTPLFYEP